MCDITLHEIIYVYVGCSQVVALLGGEDIVRIMIRRGKKMCEIDGDMWNWMHIKVCGEGRGSKYEQKVGKGLLKKTLTAVCGGNTAGLC